MPLKSFTITLIRHGETEENSLGIIQGQSDTKLNATGIQQAQLLAATFPIEEYSIAYSSDLSRAYDTCRVILSDSPQAKSGASLKDIRTDVRLRERSFGPLEGQSLDALIKLAKEHNTSVVNFVPEGGESPEDIRRRVRNFVETRLLEEAQKESTDDRALKILLVSHGGAIRELINYFVSFGHHSFKAQKEKTRIIPPNTSVNDFLVHYDLQTFAASPVKTVECLRLHDVSHLPESFQKQALSQKQVNDHFKGPAV